LARIPYNPSFGVVAFCQVQLMLTGAGVVTEFGRRRPCSAAAAGERQVASGAALTQRLYPASRWRPDKVTVIGAVLPLTHRLRFRRHLLVGGWPWKRAAPPLVAA